MYIKIRGKTIVRNVRGKKKKKRRRKEDNHSINQSGFGIPLTSDVDGFLESFLSPT